MRNSLFVLAGLCALLVSIAPVPAQDLSDVTVEPGGRSVVFGTTTIDGRQWQRLAIRPEIPLGKLAVALDVELFLNDEGQISSRGWEFGSGTEIANTIYRKIYYIRYGQPRDPVFFKVGALDDVTLGYGLAMSGYRNTLNYPGVKNLGVQVELNPFAGFNVQAMMNSLLDISNGGPVVGLRVAKPLGRLEFGASTVYDVDQFGGLTDRDGDGVPDALDRFPKDKLYAADTDRDHIADGLDRDADGDGMIDIDYPDGKSQLNDAQRDAINAIMTGAGLDSISWDLNGTRRDSLFNKNARGRDPYGVVGFDAALKLIDTEKLRLSVYGQVGMSLDDADGHKANGWGIGAPGLSLRAGPFDGRIEYRHLQDEFVFGYFNSLYDHRRAIADKEKGTVITSDASLDSLDGYTLDGVFGQAGLRLGQYARVGAQYQFLMGTKNLQRLDAVAGLGQSVVNLVPKLSRLEGFYTKRNIGLYGDSFFARTVDTSYGYNVGFALGGGVEVIWSTRWLYEPVGGDVTDVRSRKQVTLETVVRF